MNELVSILDRPEGRPLPVPCNSKALMFPVSILDRPEGRPLQVEAKVEANGEAVSILDRPEGRPLLGVSYNSSSPPVLFQSSIAPKDDRYSRYFNLLNHKASRVR